jgi:uncharacterized protein
MITQVPSEQRNWAMAAHLSALVALIGFPFGHVVGPLIVHLAKGGEFPFVAEHSKASLNYQITLSIGAILGIIVAIVVFFFIVAAGAATANHSETASNAAGLTIIGYWVILAGLVGAFAVASIVFIIMGTVAANEGRTFTYPFAIRFLR